MTTAEEKIVRLVIGKLPEGVYLATSPDIQGLVAHGNTVAETMAIAQDVAAKLLEAHRAPFKTIGYSPQ